MAEIKKIKVKVINYADGFWSSNGGLGGYKKKEEVPIFKQISANQGPGSRFENKVNVKSLILTSKRPKPESEPTISLLL